MMMERSGEQLPLLSVDVDDGACSWQCVRAEVA